MTDGERHLCGVVLDDATAALLEHAEIWAFVPGTGGRYVLTDRGRAIGVSRIEHRRNGTKYSVRAKVLTIGHRRGRPRVYLNLGRREHRLNVYIDAAMRDIFGVHIGDQANAA